MTFSDWIEQVPEEIKSDTVWRVEAYRLSLFVADLAWTDTASLFRNRPTSEHADQILRSTAKISSCVCEGYSRHGGKARSVFYEYAAGSAREARDWYFKSCHALSKAVLAHRIDLLTQILRLLLKMIGNERNTDRKVRA
jgi:four helix bundle protein